METAQFTIPNIRCEGCAETIEAGLSRLPGVQEVRVDVERQVVKLAYDPQQVTPPAVAAELGDLGFPVAGPSRSAELPGPAPRGASDKSIGYALLAAAVILLAVAGYSGYVLYPRFGLPAVSGASLLVLASGAGLAAFFSPCSFPLLVTLLARELRVEAQRPQLGRAVAFAGALSVGAAVFLLAMGVLIALGGEALLAGVTFTSDVGRLLRTLVGLLLIGLGLAQLGRLSLALAGVERLARPLLRAQARYRREHPVLGFGLLGFGYLLAGFG